MPTLIHNEVEFARICSLKTTEILKTAYSKGIYAPWRYRILAPFRSLANDVTTLCIRIGSLFCNIIQLLFLPCTIESRKKTTFSYRCTRIFLDPIQLVCTLISCIIRVTSAILGFAIPKLAIKIWLFAEKIDESMLRIKSAVIKRFHPQQLTDILTKEDIRPDRAITLLGMQNALQLEASNKNPLAQTLLTKRIYTDAEQLMHGIANPPIATVMPFFFNNFTSSYDLTTKKIAPKQGEPISILEQRIHQLSVQEISNVCFLLENFLSLPLEGYLNIRPSANSTSATAANFSSNLNKAALLNLSLLEELDEKIKTLLAFGRVQYPNYL